MDATKRLPAAALAAAEALVERAPRLPFFALVALLERLSHQRVPVGTTGPASDEGIRFKHDPSLVFSAGDVKSLSLGSGDGPPFEVTTTFLGLTGVASPLPGYIAEEVAQEDQDAPQRREFLDLFHHRLISLLVRAHARYPLWGDASVTGDDGWARRALALAGVDAHAGERPGLLRPWQLLRLSPLLAQRARTADGLATAVSTVLGDELDGARVEVRSFTGGWQPIVEERRSRLSTFSAELGRTSVLGARIVDRAGSFRLRIGPLPEPAFERLMPEGDLHPLAREVVDLYVRDPLDCELELVAAAGPAAFRLGGAPPPRLGRDTALKARRAGAQRTRVVLLAPRTSNPGGPSATAA